MNIPFVVIVDKSDGNESFGEMWQETKVFPGSATLYDVMKWAMDSGPMDERFPAKYSARRITITKPHPEEDSK